MPDTPSIVINKTFTYRGLPEEWSNKYHFVGTTPTDLAAWKALAIAIWNAERTSMSASVKFNGFTGYAAGNNTAVAIMGPDDLSTGEKTSGSTSGTAVPGDAAVWVRWATGQRGSKGRPIFLRKYFHGVPGDGGDAVNTTIKTNLATYGAKMTDGTLPGGAKIAAPQGALGTTVRVSQNYTTRTLKRRGGGPN